MNWKITQVILMILKTLISSISLAPSFPSGLWEIGQRYNFNIWIEFNIIWYASGKLFFKSYQTGSQSPSEHIFKCNKSTILAKHSIYPTSNRAKLFIICWLQKHCFQSHLFINNRKFKQSPEKFPIKQTIS